MIENFKQSLGEDLVNHIELKEVTTPQEKLSPAYSVDIDTFEKKSSEGFKLIRPQLVLPIDTIDDEDSEADDRTVRKEYKASPSGSNKKKTFLTFFNNSIHKKIGDIAMMVAIFH